MAVATGCEGGGIRTSAGVGVKSIVCVCCVGLVCLCGEHWPWKVNQKDKAARERQ